MTTNQIEAIFQSYGFRRTESRTWNQAAERWASLITHQRDYHRQQLRLDWLSSHLAGLTLSDITEDAVWHLGEAKRVQSSPSTANRHLALLRAILRACRDDWGWLQWIPKIRFYPEPEHRVRWLLPLEAARLVSHLPEHLADMAVFTLATGLRQSNVTGLQWRNLDMTRRLAWVLSTDSKSRRSFPVPLNETALSILDKRRTRHTTHVFEYQGDAPIARCSTSAWYKALERAKIEDFRWHDLRHTWASWHVQSGTSLYELQELGGWKTLDMVLRYAHLSGDQLLTAACRIDNKLLNFKA